MIIGKAVDIYRKLQMDMIGKLSVENEDIINECPFFDEGYISAQIERLKKEHERLLIELNASKQVDTDYEIKRSATLNNQINAVEVKIIHYAVNSFAALPLCKKLADGKGLKIEKLILALDEYKAGKIDSSQKLFAEYFGSSNIEAGYFLGNKIYGHILIEAGKTREGLAHLEHAVQLRVNDTELLAWLKEVYETLDMSFESDRVEEAMKILG